MPNHDVTLRVGVGRARIRRKWYNVLTYNVLLNGKTVATFLDNEEAQEYAADLFRRVVTKYHAR